MINSIFPYLIVVMVPAIVMQYWEPYPHMASKKERGETNA